MQTFYSIPPQVYEDQFWWKKDDIEFWKRELNQDHVKILELGAGTGRIAAALCNLNIYYTGLDLSEEYVQYANHKFDSFNHIDFIPGDMIDFNINKKFDYIFIGFNSFLHILNEQEAYKCLASIKSHMHSKSKLIIDIFVPHPLFLHRPKNFKMHIVDFYNSIDKEEQSINEILYYDLKSEIANVHWFYSSQNESLISEFKFKMKMYYPDTMNKLLIDSGFEITNLWGDYEKAHFSEESNLQIYMCSLI